MTVIRLLAAFAVLAASAAVPANAQPQPPQQKAAAGDVPELSKDAQISYLKELATYKGIEADMEKSLKTATDDQRMLGDQKQKVDAALTGLRAGCGEKYELDEAQFRQGTLVCGVKPPAPPAAAPGAASGPPAAPTVAPAVH